jgi:hypothetical protein
MGSGTEHRGTTGGIVVKDKGTGESRTMRGMMRNDGQDEGDLNREERSQRPGRTLLEAQRSSRASPCRGEPHGKARRDALFILSFQWSEAGPGVSLLTLKKPSCLA